MRCQPIMVGRRQSRIFQFSYRNTHEKHSYLTCIYFLNSPKWKRVYTLQFFAFFASTINKSAKNASLRPEANFEKANDRSNRSQKLNKYYYCINLDATG